MRPHARCARVERDAARRRGRESEASGGGGAAHAGHGDGFRTDVMPRCGRRCQRQLGRRRRCCHGSMPRQAARRTHAPRSGTPAARTCEQRVALASCCRFRDALGLRCRSLFAACLPRSATALAGESALSCCCCAATAQYIQRDVTYRHAPARSCSYAAADGSATA